MSISNEILSFFSILQTIEIWDVIDVFIVTVLIYQVLTLVKQTRAAQLLKGIVLLFVVYVLSTQLGLKTLGFLLTNLLQFGFIAIVVVFQPELRRALEQMGRSSIFSLSMFQKKTAEEEEIEQIRKSITAICDGVQQMSEKQTGALIVLERFSSLSEIKRSGTVVDGDISPELIGTIFYEGSPLHDGAVIITDNRIARAGCVLPLSDNLEISKDMGTRHRAALGLSEQSDAITVVVSEETGIVSMAKSSVLIRNLDRQSLYNMLTKEFIEPIEAALEKAQPKSRGNKEEKNEK
ncbi:MAG: diadenylate cyclase CdaA [Oscillospiraceae bacterium]